MTEWSCVSWSSSWSSHKPASYSSALMDAVRLRCVGDGMMRGCPSTPNGRCGVEQTRRERERESRMAGLEGLKEGCRADRDCCIVCGHERCCPRYERQTGSWYLGTEEHLQFQQGAQWSGHLTWTQRR